MATAHVAKFPDLLPRVVQHVGDVLESEGASSKRVRTVLAMGDGKR